MKKLLILAGADVHIKVVHAAKNLGVYTIVTDYLAVEDSPAKKIADEYWMLDIKDVDGIVQKCKEEQVDGVITFCIDPAQIPYQRICERLGVPCYGTKRQFEILTQKRLFKSYCKKHGVDVVHEYTLDDVEKDMVSYPVLVKPSESRGSRGQTVCASKDEVYAAAKIAAAESGDGEIIIEQYMTGCQDMSFAYMVIDSVPYLVKIGDRYLGKAVDNLERQQMATILPSRHAAQYIYAVQPSVVKMIQSMGIRFGAVFLQGFWKNGHVYMYDPGFRFPGSDFDVLQKELTGFDAMSAFVNFALTGDVKSQFGNPNGVYEYAGHICMILSISVRAGKIAEFSGMETVAKDARVFSASQRYKAGDEVPDSGDVKQRVAEFVACLPDRHSVSEFIRFVYESIKISDDNGNDMIVSRVTDENIQ